VIVQITPRFLFYRRARVSKKIPRRRAGQKEETVAPCGVPMTIWISRKVRSKILISTEIGGPEPCGGKQSCKNYMDDFL
jgi:hypothetical protein